MSLKAHGQEALTLTTLDLSSRGAQKKQFLGGEKMKAIIGILVSILAVTANAGEFFVLDMEDSILKSTSGQDTIQIKREMRQQYPNVRLRKAELMSVMMVAKTAAGKGNARLAVGGDISAAQKVDGSRPTFQGNDQKDFDRVLFKNKSEQSQGHWQLRLKGNFKVHQVVVELDTNPSEKITIPLNGVHMKSGQGNDTLALRQMLQQHQGIATQEYELIAVTLVAKSKQGGGKAQLNVGQSSSPQQTIAGAPNQFQSSGAYHKMEFDNPKGNSNGAWQIKLKGNIKVQRVVLTIKKK